MPPALDDLWSEVLRSATQCVCTSAQGREVSKPLHTHTCECEGAVSTDLYIPADESLGKAKVRDLDMASAVQKNILRLQISADMDRGQAHA